MTAAHGSVAGSSTPHAASNEAAANQPPPVPKVETDNTRFNLHPDASKTQEVPVIKGEQAYFLLHTLNDRYQDVLRRMDPNTYEAKSSEFKISDIDRFVYKFVQDNKSLFNQVEAETKAKEGLEKTPKKGPDWFKKLIEKTKSDPTQRQIIESYQLQLTPQLARNLGLIMEAQIRDFEAASGFEVTGRHEAYESVGTKNAVKFGRVLDVYGNPVKMYEREGDKEGRRYIKKNLSDIYDVDYYGDKATFVSDYVKNTPFLELSKQEQLDYLLRSYDQLDTLLERSTGILRQSPVAGEYGFMGHYLFTDLQNAYQDILKTQYGGRSQQELSLKEYKEARFKAVEKVANSYGEESLRGIAKERAEKETRLKEGSKRIKRAKAAAGIKEDGSHDTRKKETHYFEVVKDESGRVIGENPISPEEYTEARKEVTDLETKKKQIEQELATLRSEYNELSSIPAATLATQIADKQTEITNHVALMGTPGNKTAEAYNQLDRLRNELAALKAKDPRKARLLTPPPAGAAAGTAGTGLIPDKEAELAAINTDITNKTREFNEKYKKHTESPFDIYKSRQVESIVRAAENINDIVGDCFDIGERDHMLSSFSAFRNHLQLPEGVLSNAQLGEALIKSLNLKHINPNLLHSADTNEQNFAQTQILTALKGLTNAELAYDVVYQIIDKKLTAAEEGRPLDLGDLKQTREHYTEQLKRENRQETLMKETIIPGINSVSEIVNLEGRSYAIIAQNGRNEVFEYITRDDGTYDLNRVTSLGTRGNNYKDAATAQGIQLRESLLLELQYQDLVENARSAILRAYVIPGTTNELHERRGELTIVTGTGRYNLREFVANNPNSPEVQALNLLARNKLQSMEDISLEKMNHEQFTSRVNRQYEGRETYFATYSSNTILPEREIIKIDAENITVRKEGLNPVNGKWEVMPGSEKRLDEFLNDPLAIGDRVSSLSGLSDYLMTQLAPEERAKLNLESKVVQFDLNGAGTDHYNLELFVTESGNFAYYDRSDPNHVAKIKLLDGLDYFQTYYDDFDAIRRTPAGTPIMSSVRDNACVQIKSAYALSMLEAEQRRLRRR